MKPRRIQRRRTAGWRMPAGAVYVGRPSKWGNPFRVGDVCADVPLAWSGVVEDAGHAVALYRLWLAAAPFTDVEIRVLLAGRDLACWCPPGQPCHADVLLELANSPGTPPPAL